jgi:hypothetical protein
MQVGEVLFYIDSCVVFRDGDGSAELGGCSISVEEPGIDQHML